MGRVIQAIGTAFAMMFPGLHSFLFYATCSKVITCLWDYLSLISPLHPQEYETPKVGVYVVLILVSPGFPT